MSLRCGTLPRTKPNPLDKKIAPNPRYQDIEAKVNTGYNLRKYLETHDTRAYHARFHRDESFKRVRCATLYRLLLEEDRFLDFLAQQNDEQGPPNPSLAPDRSMPPPAPVTPQTASQRLQHDLHHAAPFHVEGAESPAGPAAVCSPSSAPAGSVVSVANGTGGPTSGRCFLLLDIRDEDAFDRCHIRAAQHYPISMLSRSTNYWTQAIYDYRNRDDRVIILYDNEERDAPRAATIFFERGIDNVAVLTGGMKRLFEKFPDALEGEVPFPPPPKKRTGARRAGTSVCSSFSSTTSRRGGASGSIRTTVTRTTRTPGSTGRWR